MKAINRLYQYFEYKRIKPTRLEKESGLSNGYLGVQLKRDADLGSGIIEKIADNCRDLNIEWLITGKGKMLRDFNDPPELASTQEKPTKYGGCDKCKMKDEIIGSLKSQVKTLERFISHIEKEKSSNEVEQKRKAAS
jgi:hypothetical protein